MVGDRIISTASVPIPAAATIVIEDLENLPEPSLPEEAIKEEAKEEETF